MQEAPATVHFHRASRALTLKSPLRRNCVVSFVPPFGASLTPLSAGFLCNLVCHSVTAPFAYYNLNFVMVVQILKTSRN